MRASVTTAFVRKHQLVDMFATVPRDLMAIRTSSMAAFCRHLHLQVLCPHTFSPITLTSCYFPFKLFYEYSQVFIKCISFRYIKSLINYYSTVNLAAGNNCDIVFLHVRHNLVEAFVKILNVNENRSVTHFLENSQF